MDVGSLREVITIQRPTVVVDPIGGQTEGAPETVVSNLPAAVEPLSIGTERLQVNQLRTSVSKRIRIRWRGDITAAMQVLWNGKTLEIAAVEEQVRREELHLLCAEVQ